MPKTPQHAGRIGRPPRGTFRRADPHSAALPCASRRSRLASASTKPAAAPASRISTAWISVTPPVADRRRAPRRRRPPRRQASIDLAMPLPGRRGRDPGRIADAAGNRIDGRVERLGLAAFQLRNLVTQGKNGIPPPRRGSPWRLAFSSVCSCYVLIIPERLPRVKRGSRRIYSLVLPGFAIIVRKRQNPRKPGWEQLYAGHRNLNARIYKTRTWHDQHSPSMEEMELMALEPIPHLPKSFAPSRAKSSSSSPISRPRKSWTTSR